MEEEFEEVRERFTWRKQTTNEGMLILSPIEFQYKDWCLYFALKVTLESNFRVQMSRDIKFSVHQLCEISKMAKQQFLKQTSAHRLLIKLKDTGLLSEDDYKAKQMFGASYYLKKVYAYKLDNLNDIRHALLMLRECGPLLAVIYISRNYNKCIETGEVYKYDPELPIGNEKKPITHAITVISFALENGPFLHCQDSQGLTHGEGGFLKVDVTSIKELYAFTIK